MSWVSFLAPLWALMGLIALPIILLYVLRQKRPDLPVSSTLLWSKALADMRASTPFQKLRRNLLLLLQLLILAALVFTLMRPVVQAQAARTEAGVIVIDATASMQTRDHDADESRLDRAKAEARTLVDRMRPGDRYMLIADGGGIEQVRSGFSSSKSELKSLIDSIRASDTSSDLSETLLLAATSLQAIGADARQGTPPPPGTDTPGMRNITAGKIWLFSDGAHVKLPDTMGDAGDLLNFVRIGSSSRSVGITRLSITPVPKRQRTYQVFVGLLNAWPEERRVGVALAFGAKDQFLPDQARFVTLPPNATGSVVFEEVISDPGRLFVQVDPTDDDFTPDNTAYGILAPPGKVRVILITRGNEFLERVLKTAVDVGTAEGLILPPESYDPAAAADLFILDGFLPPPDQLPAADTLFVRPLLTSLVDGAADVGGFRVAREISRPTILRWRREDPLMQYVELGDLYIGKALLMDRDTSAVELVSAPEGPLIAYRDLGSVRRYFVSFSPLTESNWWRLPSLIIFMQNVIEQTRARHFIGMPQMLVAGNPARLWAPRAGAPGVVQSARVTPPQGPMMELATKDGAAEFGATDRVGFYDVHWPEAPQDSRNRFFAVNLLSASESQIGPMSLETRAGLTVAEQTGVSRVNREIWRWLAVVALMVLVLEWWAYHRRIG